MQPESGQPRERYGRAEIGVCGSYGGLNLGDEAILAVVLGELRARLPAAVTVFSRDPRDTRARHGAERVVNLHDVPRDEMEEAIAGLDLLVVGGGGLLYDREAARFLRPAEIALEYSVPVATWAIGAGPLSRADDRDLVRRVLDRARLVTVRDRSSRLLLEEIGLSRPVLVTADPGFLLAPEPFTDEMLAVEGIDPDLPLVGVSLREPGPAAPDLDLVRCHALVADAVDFVIARTGATVLFVPMEHGDLHEAHAVAARVNQVDRVRFVTGSYSAGEIRGLIGRLDLAIGMRLHFLLFAAAAQVPLVGLTYGSKVAELLREIGAPMPPVRELGAGRLLAALDRAWDERGERLAERAARLAPLIARARRTGDLVAELLAGAPRDPWMEVPRA